MTVGDTHRDACVVCQAQHETAEMVNVAVDHIIRSLFVQQAPQATRVRPGRRRVRADVEGTAEGADLSIEDAGGFGVDQEIKPEVLSIDAPQHVQQPGFDAAAVEGAQDVKDSEGSTQVLSSEF
jgi:hypothetical protein